MASPDGKNKIQFEIKDGVPFYSVNHAETSVVNPSKLGFVFKDGDTFNSGFIVAEVKTSSFDETWEQGFNGRRVHTTLAKQLAYYVTIYPPIQMLADLPDNYDGHPAFQFLKDVPVDWDNTKVLNNEIGEYITTVRKDRNSEDWYLGSMTNEEGREFTVSLDFLGAGNYEAQIYADAPGTTWQNEPEKVTV